MAVVCKILRMGERVHIDQLLLNQGMVIFLSPLAIDAINDMGDLVDFIFLKNFIQNNVALSLKLLTQVHWF